MAQLRDFLKKIYAHASDKRRDADIDSLNDTELLELADNLRKGVPMATPVFDGAAEEEVKSLVATR